MPGTAHRRNSEQRGHRVDGTSDGLPRALRLTRRRQLQQGALQDVSYIIGRIVGQLLLQDVPEETGQNLDLRLAQAVDLRTLGALRGRIREEVCIVGEHHPVPAALQQPLREPAVPGGNAAFSQRPSPREQPLFRIGRTPDPVDENESRCHQPPDVAWAWTWFGPVRSLCRKYNSAFEGMRQLHTDRARRPRPSSSGSQPGRS